MIYPQKLSSKKGKIILNTIFIISFIIAIIMIVINKITSPTIPWAALANCGIVYIWTTVLYSIKKSTNIGGHVLLQTVIISAVVIYIDEKIGYRGWSNEIALPIIFIVANITMLILTIVSHKKYVEYVVYQLAIVLISIISIFAKSINGILGNIAIIVAILNITISLALCYKQIKDGIIRNIHM